jgi:hypothetical protein
MNSDLAIAMAILMLVGGAAQAQPNGASPRDSKACAPGAESHFRIPDTPTPQSPQLPNATTGSGTNLSDKLAQSDGVLCPPNVDPGIKAPTNFGNPATITTAETKATGRASRTCSARLLKRWT